MRPKPVINATIVSTSAFICLAVYLFATAPSELPDTNIISNDERQVDVANVFNAMNSIHDTARRIYTSRIVGNGKKAGLAFGEDWAEPSIDEGPLPALFTRLIAARMESKPPQLGLYLGSDAPINKSNLFTGSQMAAFEHVTATASSAFLKSNDAEYIAMYPDLASAEPCVSCHNEHPDSPKTDWKLNDIMGATTWTYPRRVLGSAEYLEVTDAFYSSVQEAYEAYLDKTTEFRVKVNITDEWPEKGNMTLPNADTFMAAVQAESATMVLNDLVLKANASFKSIDLATPK